MQGRVAAHNMAGRSVAYDGVPFFWTRQFDAALLYVGHASQWDEIVWQGDPAAQDFLAFYVKDGRVLAVAGMNRDRDMAALEELLRLGLVPLPANSGAMRRTSPSYFVHAWRHGKATTRALTRPDAQHGLRNGKLLALVGHCAGIVCERGLRRGKRGGLSRF